MATSNYAFVRDTRNSPGFADMQAKGWTPLVSYNDPGLDAYMQAAHQAGINPGIWGDPGQLSAEQFAQTMGTLGRKYGASALVPDIEFVGKGYQGSKGWDYNQQLANYWKQYASGMNTAITPMGLQADFNYGAWKGIANQWLPQSYGADPRTYQIDPKQTIQTLIDAGVDPSLITPALWGTQAEGYNNPYALFTADDFAANLPQAFQGQTSSTSAASPSSQSAAPASPPSAGVAPPTPRVSQSAAQIGQQGIRWGGQTFNSPGQLRSYLASKGKETYGTWAKNHPTAAQALLARSILQGQKRAV